jgi:REP-associated tyrosine transposase
VNSLSADLVVFEWRDSGCEGLAAAGLDRVDLSRLKGSDPRKVALAELLWKQTTVSQEWLAERLKMRSAANVSQLLRRAEGRRGKVPWRLESFVAGAMRGTG